MKREELSIFYSLWLGCFCYVAICRFFGSKPTMSVFWVEANFLEAKSKFFHKLARQVASWRAKIPELARANLRIWASQGPGSQLWAGSGQWGGGGGGGGGQPPSRPATQPPSHPATQPPCHLATQPSSHHIVLGLALLHFASLPLLSRLHDDDVSLQQVLVQFPCTYVCHVCVIR